MKSTKMTLVLGVVLAAALGTAPTAMARTPSKQAAKRAAVVKATKDARRGGELISVRVTACRRVFGGKRVCKVKTKVRRADRDRTCRVRYRVSLRGRRARARRIAGSARCTTVPKPAVDAPTPPARPGGTKAPAAAAPPANGTNTPPQDVTPEGEGTEHDPFDECWTGC